MKKILLAIMLLCSPAFAGDSGDLYGAITTACPTCQIVGVAIIKADDKTTWRIDYAQGFVPTQAQTDAISSTIAAFDATTLRGSFSVSRVQAMVALNNAGLLTTVQNWIATQDAITQLIWNSATTFERNSPLINKAATALNISQSQMDQLFLAAAKVKP